jgi:acylglycerol lipase
MFHGLGSHINHGGHIAHELGAKGITTYGFDYRGFGKS